MEYATGGHLPLGAASKGRIELDATKTLVEEKRFKVRLFLFVDLFFWRSKKSSGRGNCLLFFFFGGGGAVRHFELIVH